MSETAKGALAVIPARGGSKRLPRKNLLPINGLPMLTYTVRAALFSRVFKDVVFTSDDDEMLGIAAAEGCIALKRPAEYATDSADFFPVILHALKQFEENRFDDICLLMPNCPLRTAEDIQDSKKAFDSTESDFMISTFRYHMFNPYWALQQTSQGLQFEFLDSYDDYDPGKKVYCPSGAIWWARLKSYIEHGDFYGPNLQPFLLPWFRAVDIDTEDDLLIAEIVAASKHKKLIKNGEFYERSK